MEAASLKSVRFYHPRVPDTRRDISSVPNRTARFKIRSSTEFCGIRVSPPSFQREIEQLRSSALLSLPNDLFFGRRRKQSGHSRKKTGEAGQPDEQLRSIVEIKFVRFHATHVPFEATRRIINYTDVRRSEIQRQLSSLTLRERCFAMQCKE